MIDVRHPFAVYLHLSHPTGEKSARSVATPDGSLVVDGNSAGQPVGVEITAHQAVSLERIIGFLVSLDQAPLTAACDVGAAVRALSEGRAPAAASSRLRTSRTCCH